MKIKSNALERFYKRGSLSKHKHILINYIEEKLKNIWENKNLDGASILIALNF